MIGVGDGEFDKPVGGEMFAGMEELLMMIKRFSLSPKMVEERTGIGDANQKMELFEKQPIEVFDVEVTEDEPTECVADVFSSVNLDVEAAFNLYKPVVASHVKWCGYRQVRGEPERGPRLD